LALVLAEVTVRYAAPQQLIQIRPDIWVAADSVGWVNRPNVRTTINTGERTVHLYTDGEGLRVGRAGRPQAESNVLVIGDSFMEALQVEYERSFAALLEDGLTRRLGRSVAVWDAGVDGWDPPQYLIRARQLLSAHPFNLVVVSIYLGNDVVAKRVDYFPARAPQVVHHLRIPRSLHWSELAEATLYPVNDVLKRHSELFVLVKNRLQTLRQRARLTADYFPDLIRRSEATSPRWTITAEICRDLASDAEAHGAAALFMLVPDPVAVDTAVFTAYARGFGVDLATVDTDQPDRLMGGALRERGLTTISVQDGFRRKQAAGTKLYGDVDRHLSPAGNAELSASVLPLAAQMLAAAQAPSPAPLRSPR
jgi:hypothetical protein